MKDENEKVAWEMLRQSVGPYRWTGLDMFRAMCFGMTLGVLFTMLLSWTL
jgi:hypothetical protein